MPARFPLPQRVAFGPFELNTATAELTKSGTRIRLVGQPLNLLLVLLAHPGKVVSTEDLRQTLWNDGTFVDFEHGLHAAVNKLRRALGDSAENARYVETVPGQGYRFIAPLFIQAADARAEIRAEADAKIAEATGEQKRSLWKWWMTVPACLASILVGWQIHRWSSQTGLGLWQLSQLTFDRGLSYTPAISRDGTLVAYSSDRNGAGQLDLYVKQVYGNNSLRLTFDGLGNTTPNFSPDGSKIVFHSNRDGGGIYEIPTLGGQPRLLIKEGNNPKFSPDGSKIAYWIGDEHLSPLVPGTGTVWVAPLGGGQPWQVATNLTTARFPTWSPDGQGLLMSGYGSSSAFDLKAMDWWFVSLSATRMIKTDLSPSVIQAGLQGSYFYLADASSARQSRDIPRPACWSTSGTVLFSAQSGSSRNLWQATIPAESGKARGALNRLTVGAANETDPSCSQDGRIAFASVEARRNLWSAPLDLNAGKTKGPLEEIGKDQNLSVEYPALSQDGRYIAYGVSQAGSVNIWLGEIATARASKVAESPLLQRYPVLNSSGSKVAFSVYSEKNVRSLYISSAGGTLEKVCGEGKCLRATDWSNDEKSLLVFGGNPYRVSDLDIASHHQSVLVKHDQYSLLYAHYSPDNRWISFTARVDANHSRIMIAPIHEKSEIAENQWIKIAEAGPEDWANWSPDGKTLYFTSNRDEHSCLWAQKIDPVSHRPIGEAFAALHLHGNQNYQTLGWSAAGGRVVMVLNGDSGNVWLLSR